MSLFVQKKIKKKQLSALVLYAMNLILSDTMFATNDSKLIYTNKPVD